MTETDVSEEELLEFQAWQLQQFRLWKVKQEALRQATTSVVRVQTAEAAACAKYQKPSIFLRTEFPKAQEYNDIRIKQGLTHDWVGHMCGISRNVVAKALKGHATPQVQAAITWLFEESGEI